MDLSTILGIFVGFGFIFTAMMMEGGVEGLVAYWSLTAVMIVLGGVTASTLISYPLNEVISVIRIAGKAFRTSVKEPTIHMLEMVSIASYAKKEPIIKLPGHIKKFNDPFISKGIQMVADRIKREEIIRTLNTEIALMQDRHRLGREIFMAAGKYAPAFGMVGTLIGLVQMMLNLKNPDAVGPGMAMALLTTLYGAVFANLIFLPISSKLKRRSEQEYLLMEISKETILSIQDGESMTLLEDKLSAFISHSLNRQLMAQKEAIRQKKES